MILNQCASAHRCALKGPTGVLQIFGGSFISKNTGGGGRVTLPPALLYTMLVAQKRTACLYKFSALSVFWEMKKVENCGFKCAESFSDFFGCKTFWKPTIK